MFKSYEVIVEQCIGFTFCLSGYEPASPAFRPVLDPLALPSHPELVADFTAPCCSFTSLLRKIQFCFMKASKLLLPYLSMRGGVHVGARECMCRGRGVRFSP